MVSFPFLIKGVMAGGMAIDDRFFRRTLVWQGLEAIVGLPVQKYLLGSGSVRDL